MDSARTKHGYFQAICMYHNGEAYCAIIHVGTFLSGEDPFSPKRIKFPAGGERTACSTLKEQSSEILIWFFDVYG